MDLRDLKTHLALIESEILDGFVRNEKERLDQTLKCVDFYEGNFRPYPVRPPGTAYDAARWQRNTLLMNRVVKVLTGNLYKEGPVRTLPEHPEAQEWLQAVYRTNAIDALFQDADRMAVVGDVAALQVCPTEDPVAPIRIELWDASAFIVWLDPENSRRPIAVATIDKFDNQRRLRLYTQFERVTFVTDKVLDGQTNGGAAYKFQKREPNPFQLIPFSFVHFEFPSKYFWSGGPGQNIRDANDYANFFLTEQGDCIRYNTRPVIVAKNVQAGWRPPSPIRPGDIWDLPANDDAAGQGDSPSVDYLSADISFVAAGWSDLQAYLDMTLEMNGVPPNTIRLVLDSARSGIAIVAEQIPLILWAKSRQRPFADYEADLAKLVLTLGAKHLGANSVASAAALEAAATDPGLVLRWPDMFPDLPGSDRDIADQWLLDNRMTSRTQLLMRRHGFTREEAEAHLQEVAKDLQAEADLFADLDAAVMQQQQAMLGKPGAAPLETDTDKVEEVETESE